MVCSYFYETAIGKVVISQNDYGICGLKIATDENKAKINITETPLIALAAKQLNEYLLGKRKKFDIKLAPEGTEFQKQVWLALTAIPYGKTMSYKEIAAKIGNPKACRAVGLANNKNPIMIIIPCHRVIGSNGKLTGYAYGIRLKEKLLKLEKDNTNER